MRAERANMVGIVKRERIASSITKVEIGPDKAPLGI
jgi:hypothetical protein